MQGAERHSWKRWCTGVLSLVPVVVNWARWPASQVLPVLILCWVTSTSVLGVSRVFACSRPYPERLYWPRALRCSVLVSHPQPPLNTYSLGGALSAQPGVFVNPLPAPWSSAAQDALVFAPGSSRCQCPQHAPHFDGRRHHQRPVRRPCSVVRDSLKSISSAVVIESAEHFSVGS